MTMADKLMYIPNDAKLDNFPFCRLQLVVDWSNTQLNEPSIQNSIKITKVFNLLNKTCNYCKSEIKQPNVIRHKFS